ncbi:hypothetical protein PoB_006533500 [Plakobranchus ocellatus]|uniref:Uncharacterized protein n=1 Tax=Plakobranchus ocellatus TaxID=259542 RepID=A0AAV4D3W4_9GAST|nr:hypothetical protein PoB_006533500 [Plakobranchus ocellatus]
MRLLRKEARQACDQKASDLIKCLILPGMHRTEVCLIRCWRSQGIMRVRTFNIEVPADLRVNSLAVYTMPATKAEHREKKEAHYHLWHGLGKRLTEQVNTSKCPRSQLYRQGLLLFFIGRARLTEQAAAVSHSLFPQPFLTEADNGTLHSIARCLPVPPRSSPPGCTAGLQLRTELPLQQRLVRRKKTLRPCFLPLITIVGNGRDLRHVCSCWIRGGAGRPPISGWDLRHETRSPGSNREDCAGGGLEDAKDVYVKRVSSVTGVFGERSPEIGGRFQMVTRFAKQRRTQTANCTQSYGETMAGRKGCVPRRLSQHTQDEERDGPFKIKTLFFVLV